MRISGFSLRCTRKLDGPINWNQGIMDAAADCNTLIDVFDQHFEKNFWLSCVFLQEISRNTSFTLLKCQNGCFYIMSMHGCKLKFVIISHIYMLFQCCLFNLSAFCAVILEFWRKNRNDLNYMAASFQHVVHIRGYMITVAGYIMPMYGSLWPDT